ncbi:hypothetical protein EJ110_NYTH21956 [Nymphaea thermarum]|nr:hypothetical protein EJ110_NYTH21956 [Nymphaea thermarum]
MTLLKFVDLEWGSVGSFNWFATHGTSMSRTNSLISGDNKGAAARFMEDWFEHIDTLEMSKRMHSEYRNQPNSIPRRVSTMLPDQQEDELMKLASVFQSPRGMTSDSSFSVTKRFYTRCNISDFLSGCNFNNMHSPLLIHWKDNIEGT